MRYEELDDGFHLVVDGEVHQRDVAERAVTKVGDHTSIIVGFNAGRSWNGVQVRVVMEELATNQTTVRVVSKYRMETVVGGTGDLLRKHSERDRSHLEVSIPCERYLRGTSVGKVMFSPADVRRGDRTRNRVQPDLLDERGCRPEPMAKDLHLFSY